MNADKINLRMQNPGLRLRIFIHLSFNEFVMPLMPMCMC